MSYKFWVFFAATVASAFALQCTDVAKCTVCLDAIDSNGSPCRWCESAGGCIPQGLPCTTGSQCLSGGSGSSNGLSPGATAGIVVTVLVVCCCCLAICIAAAVYVAYRAKKSSG